MEKELRELDLSPRNLLLTAKDIGEFVLTRLSGGSWAELAESAKEAHLPYTVDKWTEQEWLDSTVDISL